jgi:hypothetical protein
LVHHGTNLLHVNPLPHLSKKSKQRHSKKKPPPPLLNQQKEVATNSTLLYTFGGKETQPDDQYSNLTKHPKKIPNLKQESNIEQKN